VLALRVGVGIVFALSYLLIVFGVLFARGWKGTGWTGFLSCAAILGGGAAMTWALCTWPLRPLALSGAILFLLVGAGLSTYIVQYSGIPFSTLAAAINQLNLPRSYRLLDQDRSGNWICFDVCTTVTRIYQTSGTETDSAARVEGFLREAGYRGTSRDFSNGLNARRDRIGINVSFAPAYNCEDPGKAPAGACAGTVSLETLVRVEASYRG
jgi:hypothetical protein